MAKANKPTDYASLRKLWYKKLEKSGFKDIETSEIRFNDGTAQFRRDRSMHSWEAKQAYYTMAEHFLNEHSFESKLAKTIWEYHTNGISTRNIAKILKKVKVPPKAIGKDSIWVIIKNLRVIMLQKYLNKRAVYE